MILLSFGSVIEAVDGVLDWITSILDDINGIFSDVDFTILYDWFPSDIQGVITAVIAVLTFLALLALVKKLIVFFG